MDSPSHAAPSKEFVVLMALLMSVVAISIDAMLPALGIIGEALNVVHPNDAQYIISAIFAGMAAGQLMCGPLSDAFGRKPVLYGTLFLYMIASLMCLYAATLEVMLAGRFIQGLAVAGPYISCMSIVRDRYSGRVMARVMSLVMMIFIMVPVIAPAIGQGLMLIYSWHAIFVMYIIYAMAIFIWVKWRLPETLTEENRVPFRVKSILHAAKLVITNRQTLCYTICMGCMFGALIGDLNSAQQIFQVKYNVGEMFVVYFGLQALAFGASSLLNSRLVERLGMRYICVRALLVLTLVSCAFLILTLIMHVTFWMFFSYGVVALFCVGLLFGNLNALALEPMGHMAGIASAIIGAMSSVISIICGTIIGQMYDGTIIPLITGFAVLGTVAWIFLIAAESNKQVSGAILS